MSDYIPIDDPIEIPPTDGGTVDAVFVSHLRFQDFGMTTVQNEDGNEVEIRNMPVRVTTKYMNSETRAKVYSKDAYKLSGNLAIVAQNVPSVQACFDNFTRDLATALPDWKAWEDSKNSPEELS